MKNKTYLYGLKNSLNTNGNHRQVVLRTSSPKERTRISFIKKTLWYNQVMDWVLLLDIVKVF